MLRRAAQELIVETQDGNSSASCNKIIMIICIILGVSVMHLFNDHYKKDLNCTKESGLNIGMYMYVQTKLLRM